MLKKTMVLSAVLCTLLVGCGQSTMDKLKSDTKDEGLTSAFWAKEKADKTALWQEAEDYCKTHYSKVNCGALNLANMIANGSTEMKGYGKSGDVIDIYGGRPAPVYHYDHKK